MPRISARELCVAISIEEDDATIDVYGAPSVDEIMVHTSSLLRLSQDERYMEFAHFTVEEYLRSIDPQERPELARYRWDEFNAATCQIETCLTFLNLEEFRPSLCETLNSFQQFLHTHPFYARASVLWTSYSTLGEISGRAAKSVNKFFGPSDITFAFDNWLQVRLLASHLYESDRYSDPISAPQHGISTRLLARSRAVAASTSKLHIAAIFYLVDLIPGLIKTGLQLDALSPFGTALHCALVGEKGMVELMEGSRKTCFVRGIALRSTISVLLEQGANARIPFNKQPTGIIATPLYLATLVCATQQLLDAGAVLDENTVRAIMQVMDDRSDLDLEPLAQLPLESVNDRDRRYAEQLLMRINPGRVLTASNTTPLGQATLLGLDDTLRHACQYNELSVFRWIFERCGLDANHRDHSGRSLLHLACESFSADVVAYLIERGVDPNIKDKFGCSPLVYYFNSSLWKWKTQNRPFNRQNCLATFKCMVGHNVQLRMLTTSGDTALICWAECQSTELDVLEEILRVLLNQGLDIGSRNAHGRNVWHLLAFHNHFKHLEMLRSSVDDVAFGPSIDIAGEDGFTPILDAAKKGSVGMFDFLIEQGCDITSVTSNGESILHLAAWGIWYEHSMLESLVAKYMHTEIAQLTSDGYTIAHSCVLSITTHDHRGTPPVGIPQRFRKSIESLLSLSISIVDTDLQGKTPLDHLCQWIANEGYHGVNCRLCKDCFECFEMLIFHCDAKAEPSWTTILLRGLASEAEADPDDSPAAEYPEDTILSRAICLAMDRGFFLNDLGAELDLDSILDIAVRLRQESLILKLLDTENMDFDRPSRKEPHLTPLQSLCTHCCPVSTIRIAISRTRNVCRSDSRGQGPLHMLFSNDEAQHAHMAPTIRALLDAGLDIDGRADMDGRSNHAGCTALMMAAASESSSDAVGTLLSSGAKVDLCDSKGWNALLRACHSGTESAIKELIDAGSPIVHRSVKTYSFPKTNKQFCGPIQLAAGRGLTDIVKILLPFEETIERSDSNDNPPSPLMTACVGSHVTVRLLLERGYDPNLLDASLGMRPLHVASWAGKTEIVHALLETGCDKEAPDQDGIKALVLATMQGHEQIAKMLEGTGNDVGQAVSPTRLLQFAEYRNNGPTTTKDSEELPIHSRAMTRYAVCQPQFGRFISRHLLPDSIRPFFVEGSLRVVESAALSGLNMEGYFKSCSCTPMLVAVSHRQLETVIYLVSIEVPLLTGDQCSLHYRGEYTVSELLAADPIWAQLVGQWFNRPKWRAQLSRDRILCMIASAIANNNPGPLDVLLDKIARPFPSCELLLNNCKIKTSEFLHLAAEKSGTAATSCADMLVSRGLDVDCLDRDLQTPLQEASSRGHLDMVKLLLSHNAAVNVANSETGTALSVAAKEGHVSVIDQLLTSGADPNLCVMPGLAPVTCAAKEGQYAAFRVLLNAGGTAKPQDYYDLCDRGYRSVLMLDNEYFCTMQGPNLLHSILFFKSLPIFKSMPLARRIWSLATLMPEKQITSLYFAALDGGCQSVDLIVEYGAAINMEGGPEGTPLMAACIAGHLPIVKYLVQRGALLAYWNGTNQVSAFAKAQRHPKILRWLLFGRFTERLRLKENPTGGEMYLDVTTEACHREADEINFQLTLKELVLRHDVEGYLERNFWFVSARRFVDSGHGSFDELDIPPSEFAKYKPGFV
jgi:ankyrin repeat protein